MKLFKMMALAMIFFLSLYSHAEEPEKSDVEELHLHIHKHGPETGTPKEKKDEEGKKEEKEEEKKPELPQPSVLKINAYNNTDLNLGIHGHAGVEGKNNEQIMVENISPAHTPQLTLGTLITEPKATFNHIESWAYTDKGLRLDCHIIEQEKAKPEDKEKGDGKKESKEEEEELKEGEQAPNPEPEEGGKKKEKAPEKGEGEEEAKEQPEFKKSIDFHFYIPEGQESPACAIGFDGQEYSLPGDKE